jgi:hypothetical protein
MEKSNIDWTKHKRRRRSKRFLSIKLILKMTKKAALKSLVEKIKKIEFEKLCWKTLK